MGFIKGKKTYIIAGLMVAKSVVGMVTGDIGVTGLLMSPDFHMLLEGLGIGALRNGIK
tara:strand:- start:16940 stop:17113 length:174 start_codon:yes stop_codon:yes gene_type:complete